jgi:hypothetical protein
MPVQAAAMLDMEPHAPLHGIHAYPRAGGSAAYQAGDHGRELDVHLQHAARLAGAKLVVYVHGVGRGPPAASGEWVSWTP